MTLSPNLRRQRLRNLLLKFGGDEELLKAYLLKVGRRDAEALLLDEKIADALIDERDARKISAPEGPKSPLYRVPLLCPGHPDPRPFQGWLCLGHQRVEENLFGVPRVLEGMDGYQKVDYVLLETHVCPVCRYASPFRQDFAKPGEAIDRSPHVLTVLKDPESHRARLALSRRPVEAFADPGRDAAAGREAFALALLCAQTARKASENASAYKEAHIRLRLARLDEDEGRPADARAQYEGALKAYLDYRDVELPAELLARTSRQIVVLGSVLGQDELAKQVRAQMFESRTKATRRLDEQEHLEAAARRANPESLPEAVTRATEVARKELTAWQKYFTQADEVWGDRELHRLKT